MKSKKNCCKKENSMKKGLLYGLIPHTGCMAFIIFSILGVTFMASLFRPLLANSNIFYAMIILSFVFAGISGIMYLKKINSLNVKGAKQSWKYLTTLFTTTVAVNLVLFLIIFPYVTAYSFQGGELTGEESFIELTVDIPCSGHAPLIIGELNELAGVVSVEYKFPNIFKTYYEGITEEEILAIPIFQSYPAVKN